MSFPPDRPSDLPVHPHDDIAGNGTYVAEELSDAQDPGSAPVTHWELLPPVMEPPGNPQPQVEAEQFSLESAELDAARAAAGPASAPSAAAGGASAVVDSGPEATEAPKKRRGGMGEDPAKLRQGELPDPPPVQGTGPAVVLAVCNQKGGVGKTTTTINLGAALAEFGRRVLLVDFDPQGALSVGLGIAPHDLDLTVYNLLVERRANPQDVVLRTSVKGVDLLPANIDLSAAEIQLVNEVAREQTLERVLRPLIPQYDYILIDCQPSLGLLTVNALTAARGVLIPLECEYFSLRGVALLIDTVEKVRDRLNPDLELEGILATMYDPRTIHAREVFTRIVEAFGDIVFRTTINRTVRFPETTVAGEPITSWAPTSPAAEAYRNLAREILARDAES